MNQVRAEQPLPHGGTLQIVQGDLTLEHVDAIVNAANAHLQHGGGVAGAIVKRGGPQIQVESNAWVRKHGPVSHAQPAFTTAGGLPCRYIIHAVGPVWGSGDEDTKLASAVTGVLHLADALDVNTLALPAISTGIFGFPKERAAKVVFQSLRDYFTLAPQSKLTVVRITIIDDLTVKAFITALEDMPSIS